MGASVGYQGKLGISASSPVDASFDFISESLRLVKSHISHDGIHGKRGEQAERIREGIYTVGGSISMQPCPEELAALLPWALGANASGTTFALAETLPSRYITIDRAAKVPTYTGCCVNSINFQASEGSPMNVTFDIVGKTETIGDAASFPNLTNTLTTPFMFHDAAVTIAGNSEAIKSFNLTVNNNLLTTFNNSQSAANIVPGPRSVTLELTTPYSSSETDLYDLAVTGVAVVITLTNGNYSIVFSIAKWQVPAQSPNISGKGAEITLPLAGICRRSSTTQELVVTLDSTP